MGDALPGWFLLYHGSVIMWLHCIGSHTDTNVCIGSHLYFPKTKAFFMHSTNLQITNMYACVRACTTDVRMCVCTHVCLCASSVCVCMCVCIHIVQHLKCTHKCIMCVSAHIVHIAFSLYMCACTSNRLYEHYIFFFFLMTYFVTLL